MKKLILLFILLGGVIFAQPNNTFVTTARLVDSLANYIAWSDTLTSATRPVATRYWVNSQGFITSGLQWSDTASTIATKNWVNSQNFLDKDTDPYVASESDPVWISDSSGYLMKIQFNDSLQANVYRTILGNWTFSNALGDASIADNITLTNITQITNRSHTSLSDIGANTHSQIDSFITHVADDTTNFLSAYAHISLTNNPHSVTATQLSLGNLTNKLQVEVEDSNGTAAGNYITRLFVQSNYLASSSFTASAMLDSIKTVDGSGSLLDADFLDGQSGAYYLAWANFTGVPTTLTGFGLLTETKGLISDSLALALLKANFVDSLQANVPRTIAGTWTFSTPLADASVADNITLTNITQITNRSHTSLTDIGTNTHSQIDNFISHVADDTTNFLTAYAHVSLTNNPHSVTATQVSLGNLTNKLQVEREDSNTVLAGYYVTPYNLTTNYSTTTAVKQFISDSLAGFVSVDTSAIYNWTGAYHTFTGVIRQGPEITGAAVPTFISYDGTVSTAYDTPVQINLNSGSLSTARGLTIWDKRTVDHQPSVSVLNPVGSDIFGMGWNGAGNQAQYSTATYDINFLPAGSSALYLKAGGNVGIGTTDFDGTPAIGRLIVKGSTADGSTNIFVGRDSGEANVFTLDTDGNVTASGSLTVSGSYNYFADSSSVNDSWGVVSTDITAYTTGMQLFVNIGVANTDGATLELNSLGAKAVLKNHDVALATGDVESGQIIHVIYDGTQWQMLSQLAQ